MTYSARKKQPASLAPSIRRSPRRAGPDDRLDRDEIAFVLIHAEVTTTQQIAAKPVHIAATTHVPVQHLTVTIAKPTHAAATHPVKANARLLKATPIKLADYVVDSRADQEVQCRQEPGPGRP